MKKIIISTILAGVIATTPFGFLGSANAESLDNADIAFLSFMNINDNISYTRRPLYSECFEQSGWQYDFDYADTYGFALITSLYEDDQQIFEVEEVYYEQSSPFDYCEGLPIYITFNLYVEYKDNFFIDLSTDEKLSEEKIAKAVRSGFGHSGSGNNTEINETVYYANKTENTYSIKGDLPKYSSVEGGTNCANVAGSVLVGYYDRFCENLIPNFVTYRMLGTAIIYKAMTSETGDVVIALKDLMGTDKNQSGTTFTGFQNGMSDYARIHGYTYSSESVLTGGNFDFSKYKQAVENNKPVALFLSNYAFLNKIQEDGGQDVITSEHSTVAHVVIACGYMQHNYYNSIGQKTEERTYLKVCSGFAVRGIC